MILTGFLEVCGIGFILPLISLLSVETIEEMHPAVISFHSMLGSPDKTDFIITCFALFILLYVIKNTLLTVFFWYQTKFVVGVQRRLSSDLYKGYISHSYGFHLKRNSSELIRNCMNEVAQFAYSVLMPLFALSAEVIVLLTIFCFLCFIEPLGTALVSVILLSVMAGFYYMIRNRLTQWGKCRQEHEGLRLLHLQQGMGAIKEVKIFGSEKFFKDAYGISNNQVAMQWTKQIFFTQVPRFGVELMAVTALLSFAILLVLLGKDSYSIISTLGLFAAAAFRLIPSSNRILASIQAIRFGLPTLDLISKEITEIRNNVPENDTRKKLITGFDDRISVENLVFNHHRSEKPIISGITFEVAKGESMGIIGPSGAGKSTLVDLLLGLHQPREGRVMIDGIDIGKDMRGWRSQIGYVPQSVFISDSSLRENVAFGIPKEEIEDAKIWEVLAEARLEDFVRSLEEGLDTILGEKGARISGGQRQRIGIARALYRNPGILMFDEATSALDHKTEMEFMETIHGFKGRRTMLIIAHRLSTIEHCENVVHMKADAQCDVHPAEEFFDAAV